MTDREMLELAGKAAGLKIRIYAGMVVEVGTDVVCVDQRGFKWNPLTDDGDALRLAVKLGLVVCVLKEIGMTGIYLPAEHVGGKYDVVESHENDPCAATRRAIVLAAAEIGKSMQ